VVRGRRRGEKNEKGKKNRNKIMYMIYENVE
jgi:hypothetical protein